MFGVFSGQKKGQGDLKTRWWNEEVEESVQRKSLARKQEHLKDKERGGKGIAYSELYVKLNSRIKLERMYSRRE